MKSIAIFCGSSDGASSIYRESAQAFGHELAERNITLIYGGASVGLMGAVADVRQQSARNSKTICRV